MIAGSQGAPFLLNFDERSMAGMMREARRCGLGHLINADNVHDYASVGCLENTMVGNDRSGTVDINLNLLKAVELALTGGYDLVPFVDPMTGKADARVRRGPATGDATTFTTFEQFWDAYAEQTRFIVQRIADLYEASESRAGTLRAHPVPVLPRPRLRREGARRHPGRRGDQLRHDGSRHLRHHRGFAARGEAPRLRPQGVHAWRSWSPR